MTLRRTVFAEQGVDPSALVTGEEEGWELLVAGPTDAPVGGLAIRWVGGDPPVGKIASVVVRRGHRTGFLALRMMTSAAFELRRRGAARIVITVLDWKRDLLASYERLGFRPAPSPTDRGRVDLVADLVDVLPRWRKVRSFFERRGADLRAEGPGE